MGAGDEVSGIMRGDYDLQRAPVERDAKHRSVRQRYAKGYRWEDTDIFRDQYPRRFAAGGMVRGAWNIDDLAHQYYTRVDAIFEDMKRNGFRLEVNGRPVPLPNLHIGHDGEPLLGNNGNHRVAMAQVIGLDTIHCKVQSMHTNAPADWQRTHSMTEVVAPTADAIPAMTTLAERQAYYRLAREMAPRGAVVELGAWLGASTVYLASGVRDSGENRKVHVYDRWHWDASHERKVIAWRKDHPGEGYCDSPMPTAGTMFERFEANLGDLRPFVKSHVGEITAIKWDGGQISLIVFDAPKRVKEIVSVLKVFGPHVCEGTRFAWQDFAHFPSYEIVACLYRLKDYLTFDYGVAPGTTAVFTVKEPWPWEAAVKGEISLSTWSPDEVISAWDHWTRKLPEYMRARFRCGAAMFLCDIGKPSEGQALLRSVIKDSAVEVLPKWNYIRQNRSDLAKRYAPLFAELPC